ncbi:MAG: energy transducer TonB [Gammaproteobacteria bacterium]
MRNLVSSNISLLTALPVDARMGEKGRGVLTADRLGPLAGVIAVHLALVFWANSVMTHEALMSTASAPVVTGVLLALPAPEPAVEPPRPLPIKRPVPKEPAPLPPEEPLIEAPVTPPEGLASEEVITQAAPAPAPADEGEPEPEAPQVIPPRIDASQLDNPAPAYPARSRQLREQGRVLLDVYILPDGSVGEIRLRESSGFQRLDRSALETVKLWRYIPARRGGQPIPYWYVQPINFLLR